MDNYARYGIPFGMYAYPVTHPGMYAHHVPGHVPVTYPVPGHAPVTYQVPGHVPVMHHVPGHIPVIHIPPPVQFVAVPVTHSGYVTAHQPVTQHVIHHHVHQKATTPTQPPCDDPIRSIWSDTKEKNSNIDWTYTLPLIGVDKCW